MKKEMSRAHTTSSRVHHRRVAFCRAPAWGNKPCVAYSHRSMEPNEKNAGKGIDAHISATHWATGPGPLTCSLLLILPH